MRIIYAKKVSYVQNRKRQNIYMLAPHDGHHPFPNELSFLLDRHGSNQQSKTTALAGSVGAVDGTIPGRT